MPIVVRLLRFLGWPIVAGVAAAVVLLLLFPELLKPAADNGQNPTKTLAPSVDQWQGPVSYADAVNRAAPSVVNIYTRKRIARPRHPLLDDPIMRQLVNAVTPRTREYIGLGSGVILSDEGYILTNLHVVAGASQIWVQLQDGREAVAAKIGSDKQTDLTVLKIELDNLTAINIGDSMHARVGDVVLAIGNPHGVGQTVTQGIISASGQKDFGNNFYSDSIQTDAAINPGNSGGALVDAHGDLLGINSKVLDRSNSYGISFAIPADIAIKVLKDIIKYGRVIRGWVGIGFTKPLSAKQVQQLGLGNAGGLLVESLSDGPASSAGLQVGDIIIGLNGHRRTDRPYIANLRANLAPGDLMKLEVLRNGKLLDITIVAGTAPATAP